MNYIFENASSQTKLKNKRALFLSTKQSYNKVSIQLVEAGYLSPIVKEYIYIYIYSYCFHSISSNLNVCSTTWRCLTAMVFRFLFSIVWSVYCMSFKCNNLFYFYIYLNNHLEIFTYSNI